jgi:cytochrome P450
VDTQDDSDPENRMPTREVLREILLYLFAGSDTTGNTIGFALIKLLGNPEKLKKLYEEIDSLSFLEGTELFSNEQLKTLPYLNAVIQETLRILPVSGAGLQRITEGNIVLNGEFALPKGVCKYEYFIVLQNY